MSRKGFVVPFDWVDKFDDGAGMGECLLVYLLYFANDGIDRKEELDSFLRKVADAYPIARELRFRKAREFVFLYEYLTKKHWKVVDLEEGDEQIHEEQMDNDLKMGKPFELTYASEAESIFAIESLLGMDNSMTRDDVDKVHKNITNTIKASRKRNATKDIANGGRDTDE